MGLILDSSSVIASERKWQSAANLLFSLREKIGPELIAISVVSVVELEHGIWRAKDERQARERQKFFNDLFAAVPIYPLTFQIARRAARIDGEARREDVVIPFQDLIIGVTALEFEYSVATLNVRHFQLIPNLQIKQL